jgi:hypothetical protein
VVTSRTALVLIPALYVLLAFHSGLPRRSEAKGTGSVVEIKAPEVGRSGAKAKAAAEAPRVAGIKVAKHARRVAKAKPAEVARSGAKAKAAEVARGRSKGH